MEQQNKQQMILDSQQYQQQQQFNNNFMNTTNNYSSNLGNQDGNSNDSNSQNQDEKNNDGSSNNAQNQKIKQKRRTRHDPNHRDFMCGCQRAYLSYPALYTHIKQKHNGVPPEGTAIPQDRGRSVQKAQNMNNLNNEDSQSIYAEINPVSQNLTNNFAQNNKQFIADKLWLRHLLKFLKSLQINFKKENDENEISEKLFFEKVFNKIINIEPHKIQIEELKTKVMDAIEKINIVKEEFDPIREIKKSSLNQLFVAYLLEVGKYVNQNYLNEIILFLSFYRKALNLNGWQQLDYSPENIVFQKEFCEENDGESALLIANQLIIDYLPEYCNQIQEILQFNIIGNSEEKLKNAVYLTQNFSYWLYDNHYSNAKLIIQPDDDHTQQNNNNSNSIRSE